MDNNKQFQIEEMSFVICQYLVPCAYKKDTPPIIIAKDIATRLVNLGYRKVREEMGDFIIRIM